MECNSRFIAEFRNANVIAVDGRSDLATAVKASPLYWKSNIIPIVEWVTPDSINSIMDLGEEQFGKVDIFSRQVDIFPGQVDIFSGQVDIFSGRVEMLVFSLCYNY